MPIPKKDPKRQSELLDNQAKIIAGILSKLSIDPDDSAYDSEDGHAWRFRWGSALIEVCLVERGNAGFFQVLSPLIEITSRTKQRELYLHLLELNLYMTSAAMGVHNNTVYIFSERAIDGMDSSEAQTLITRVSRYADNLDDQLVKKFGGKLYDRQ